MQPHEIIRTALALDGDLLAISVAVPVNWCYTTTKVPPLTDKSKYKYIWGDNVHMYRSITASSMWNNYRAARILIHEIIVDAAQQIRDSEIAGHNCQQASDLATQSRETGLQLVEDICATIPFHLGTTVKNAKKRYSPRSKHVKLITNSTLRSTSEASYITASARSSGLSSAVADATPFVPMGEIPYSSAYSLYDPSHKPLGCSLSRPPFKISAAGGETLVWPCLVAANSGFAPSDLRKWIISCLDHVGHTTGFHQTLAAAHLLRSGMHPRAWLALKSP
jgi:hypothetical protein